MILGGGIDPLSSLKRILGDATNETRCLVGCSGCTWCKPLPVCGRSCGFKGCGKQSLNREVTQDRIYCSVHEGPLRIIERRLPLLKRSNQRYLKAEEDESLCTEAQSIHLNNETADSRISVEQTSYRSQFILGSFWTKAASETSRVSMSIFQYEERPASPLDVMYLKNVGPKVIGCKLRSADDVARALQIELQQKSCAAINLEVMKQVASYLPKATILELEDSFDFDFRYYGNKNDDSEILLGEGFRMVDKKKSRGDEWKLFSIFECRVMTVSSPSIQTSVITPLGNPSNPFYGAHYCKVAPAENLY